MIMTPPSYEVHIVVAVDTSICLPHAGMLWIFNWSGGKEKLPLLQSALQTHLYLRQPQSSHVTFTLITLKHSLLLIDCYILCEIYSIKGTVCRI